jgi:hypothetical protein
MIEPETTLEKLRAAASSGVSVRGLIDMIRSEKGAQVTTFEVMSLFVKAFAVSLADLRELPGAKCLGGAVYEDDAIEAVIGPAIAKARFRTTGFKH